MIKHLITLLFIIVTATVLPFHSYADSQAIDPKLRQLLSEAINSAESFDDRFHAEVWLLDMSRRLEKFVKDENTRIAMLKQVHHEATRAETPARTGAGTDRS